MVTAPVVVSPCRSIEKLPRIPFETFVLKRFEITDGRVASDLAIASSRTSAASAVWAEKGEGVSPTCLPKVATNLCPAGGSFEVGLPGTLTVIPSAAVPATKIEVQGDEAFLYFECHDVGNFASGSFDDPAVKTIVNDTFLAGTLRNVGGSWLFSNMTAGPSSPLSL
jgi:hypothetical protein